MKSSNIGGQAVLEGIMMKNQDRYAVAVRKPDGEIFVQTETFHSITGNWKKLTTIPFVRGVFNFLDSMVLGIKTLAFSASFYEEEEEKELSGKDLKKKEKQENLMMAGTVAFSIVAAVAIFMILPYFLSTLMKPVIPSYHLRTVIEGVVRIGIFIVYILLISRMEDIQRTFMYHGAEHKCINCIEHGMELNVENVMKSSREHKRCGTSFLLIVMVVSIILHMFIRVDSKTLGFVIRILLLPVVAGISYEFIRLAGTSDNRLVALLSKPGMALQHMTTREPGPDMVEVAIASVEAVFDWKKFLNENFGANYELTEKEYVVGETIVPGTEKKSAAQLKKTEEVTA